MMNFNYTLTRPTNYSDLEHLAAAASGDELPLEEVHELEVEFSVYGSYRPATWEDPAEYPEMELGRIVATDEHGKEYEITLTRQEERLVEEAAWRVAEDYARDYEPDYYDDVPYDDYPY